MPGEPRIVQQTQELSLMQDYGQEELMGTIHGMRGQLLRVALIVPTMETVILVVIRLCQRKFQQAVGLRIVLLHVRLIPIYPTVVEIIRLRLELTFILLIIFRVIINGESFECSYSTALDINFL